MTIRRYAPVGLAAAALFGAVVWPMLGGKVYVGDDLKTFHLPTRAFYAERLAAGESPAWWPSVCCGVDLHAEGQVGMLHPWHLALYRGLPLSAAFNLEFLTGYVVAFAGTGLFLARKGLPGDAALFGAMVFTFSGFNLLHFMHMNFVAVVAQLPWLLLAIDAGLAAPGGGNPAGARLAVALLTASQLLLGYPQAVWLSLVGEGVYVATATLGRSKARRWDGLSAVAGAKVLGLLMGCAQLVPTWEALRLSGRASPTREFLGHGSMHPINLIQVVAPYLIRGRAYVPGPHATGVAAHELGVYIGAVFPVLVTWLIVRRGRLGGMRGLEVFAGTLGAIGVVLAVGSHGPFFDVLASLPLVGSFRMAGRSMVLAHFAAAVLAAVAFADLSRFAGQTLERRSLGILAVPVLVSAALAAYAVFSRSGRVASAGLVAVGPVMVGVATAAVVASAFGKRGAVAALVLFAALDQGAYGISELWRDPPTDLASLRATRTVPPSALSDGTRVVVPEGDNLWTLSGARLVNGYVGLMPANRPHEHDSDARRVAGASWLFQGHDWQPLPGAFPRAWLAPDDSARLLRSLSTSVDRDYHVTLPVDAPPPARTLVDRPGLIRLGVEVSGRKPTLLVVSERHQNGWRASLDGRPCPLLRVSGSFLGCLVDPGRHVAEFRFAPMSHRVGAWVSVFGMAGALGAWLWGRRGL